MPKKTETTAKKPVEVTTAQKLRVGIVDKISGTNTVRVVSYERLIHPIYKKRYTRTHRILADTAAHEISVGDKVVLRETRLISKHKAWIVSQVEKSAQA